MMTNNQPGMTVIVKTITRLTVGVIFLYGIYIVLHGHLTPGGGFAGGVIIALAFVHLLLAFGKEVALKRASLSLMSVFESLGGLMFLTLAVLGFLGGFFFINIYGKGTPFALFSAHQVLLSNIAIGCKVGAGLFALVIGMIILTKTAGKK
jgi:multisubunit Na+/H+ antiporter MnhB subunit